MKIIDANDFNLRTTAFLMQRPELEILLIPVCHIGSQEFYQEVNNELDTCDLILFEGVGLKKMKGLAKAYRRFARRLGLVYQGDEIDLKKIQSRAIRADLDIESAEEEWNKIPWISRLLFRLLFPIGLTVLAYTETKATFSMTFRERGAEDYTPLWFMNLGQADSIENFVMSKREAALFETIDRQLAQSQNVRRIGIIYGAAHMAKVIRYLTKKYSFRIADAWFLTVFWMGEHRFEYKRRTGLRTEK